MIEWHVYAVEPGSDRKIYEMRGRERTLKEVEEAKQRAASLIAAQLLAEGTKEITFKDVPWKRP